MCQFKSGIIFKDSVVVAPGGNESHSDLLESLGVEDDCFAWAKKFVRVELVPKSEEWWISPEEHPEKWTFIIDQDILPDWFDREEAEVRFRFAVCEWWKAHVLVNQNIETLSDGFYRIKGCEVGRLTGNVKVGILMNSQVHMVDEKATIEFVLDSRIVTMTDRSYIYKVNNSKVGTMKEKAIIEIMKNSNVDKMENISLIEFIAGKSNVEIMKMHSKVISVEDVTNIHIMEDGSCVENLIGMSNIEIMKGRSWVTYMSGGSSVGTMKHFSSIGTMKGVGTISAMKDHSIARDCRGDSIKILTPENFDLIAYKK